jgi:hypothetical protein
MLRKALLCVILAGTALAGEYEVKRFPISNVATTTTETVVTLTQVTGKPVAFAWLGETNMNVSLRTVAGYGASLVARTVVADTNAMSFWRQTPEGVNEYLVLDRVELVAHSAPYDTNAVYGGEGILILEKP